jgi:hypothetical protein
MKMVKSLLLGSAAGLVAVTAGQAADLPVKARPVQYVKICSLYGAGFYYMPGTDMCLKIGGWVRAEVTGGQLNGNMTWGPFNANANNRTTNNLAMRARGYITADAREQTGYGVARAYIAVGINTSDTGFQVAPLSLSSNRAYLQWAGFTAGLAQSFYDFYSVPAAQYRGGYLPASDTGDGGWWVWGYTAQFGGGLSATLAAEQRRATQICDQQAVSGAAPAGCTIAPGGYSSAGSGGVAAVAPGSGAYGGEQWPDVVANLRVDQAWGAAQVMGALHNVNASYYSAANTLGSNPSAPTGGHPGDAVGFAVGAGIKILFPSVAPGDYFQGQVNYAQGASRYVFNTPNTNWGAVDGNSEAYGVLSDCVYGGTVAVGNNTSCQLTTAWGFNASFEHYWTPQWHQSLYGAYAAVNYNNSANAMLCAVEGNGNNLAGTLSAGVPGCSNNWSMWGIGSRLQWDVTKSFYVGVEALYEDLHSATSGCATLAACGVAVSSVAFGGATLGEADSHAWTFTLRMHKDFLP